MLLWHNVLMSPPSMPTPSVLHNTLMTWGGGGDQCTAAFHQWAGHATYEEAHGGHAAPPRAHHRGNGRMWAKKSAHSTQPQEDTRQEGQGQRQSCKICPAGKDRKATAGVPSEAALCVRAQTCDVICEVLTWTCAQSVLFYLYSIIVYIHHSTIVTLQKQWNITVVLWMIYVICECEEVTNKDFKYEMYCLVQITDNINYYFSMFWFIISITLTYMGHFGVSKG